MTVVTSQRAVLSCESTGIPAPQVSWKRNGSPLNMDLQSGAYRFEVLLFTFFLFSLFILFDFLFKNSLYDIPLVLFSLFLVSIYLLTNTNLI